MLQVTLAIPTDKLITMDTDEDDDGAESEGDEIEG